MSADGDRDDTEVVDVVVRVGEGGRASVVENGDGTCPRCGGDLSDYTLFGRETVACDDCGFLDADADHTAPSVERESWDAALERFREKFG